MKYCRHCGGEVEDNDVFCGYCGSKLKSDAPQEKREESKQDFVTHERNGEDFVEDIDKEFSSYTDRCERSANANVEREEYHEGGARDMSSNAPKRKQLLQNKHANSANTYGILSIVFGILGGVLGIVFGILGLCEASKAKKLCETGDYDGKPKASNGKMLSIIGLVMGVCVLLFYIF